MQDNNILDKSLISDIFLNNSYLSIVVTDKDRNLILVNDACCKLFGYEKEEIIGKNEELIHIDKKSYEEFGEATSNHILENKSINMNYEFKKKDGSSIWAKVSVDFLQEKEYIVWTLVDITDMKIAQKELEEQKNLLQTIIDDMPAHIIMKDYEGKFVLVNESIAKLYNSTPEEMIGKDDSDYISDKKLSDEFRRNVREIMDKGETQVVYEDSIDVTTNEVRNYMSIKKPLVNDNGEKTILVLANDITDMQKTQKELKEKSKLLNEIINGISFPIILKDYNGKFILVNDATAELYNSTPEEMVGKDDSDYIPNKKMARSFKHNVKDIMDEGESRVVYENSIDVKTNEIRNYMSIKKPLVNDKGEKSILVLASDITELNKKNEELLKKEKLLFEQAKQAQMGEMIGNIAHQWRQPLSAISTAASGMKVYKEMGTIDKDQEMKMLDLILDNTEFLSDTIDTFRNYTLEQKQVKEVVIQECLNKTIGIVEDSLKNGHIKLIKKTPQNPVKTKIILGELAQVVINLINNAKDVLLSEKVENPTIQLELSQESNKFVITVEDNGGGINNDVIVKIFDPYFTTKHKSQGTGLGLYMSKEIIEKHLEGKLLVENGENGAIFTIILPIIE